MPSAARSRFAWARVTGVLTLPPALSGTCTIVAASEGGEVGAARQCAGPLAPMPGVDARRHYAPNLADLA